jgi:hypothetical protein
MHNTLCWNLALPTKAEALLRTHSHSLLPTPFRDAVFVPSNQIRPSTTKYNQVQASTTKYNLISTHTILPLSIIHCPFSIFHYRLPTLELAH